MSVREGTHLFNTTGPEMNQLHPYERLKLAIIHRAVLDWDSLIQKKAWKRELSGYNDSREFFDFAEIRRFFKSDWCALLLQNAESYPPLVMLERLEKKLRNAMSREGRICQ